MLYKTHDQVPSNILTQFIMEYKFYCIVFIYLYLLFTLFISYFIIFLSISFLELSYQAQAISYQHCPVLAPPGSVAALDWTAVLNHMTPTDQ